MPNDPFSNAAFNTFPKMGVTGASVKFGMMDLIRHETIYGFQLDAAEAGV